VALSLFLWLTVPLVIVQAAAGAPQAARPACSAWASPAGADSWPGTRERPFKSIGRLLQALGPGLTGCLEPGAVFDEHVVIGNRGTPRKPVTLMTPSEPKAVIANGVEYLQSSRDVVLRRISVRVTGAEPWNSRGAVVLLGGFRNRFVGGEVSGGGATDTSRACIFVEHGNRAVVDGNLIHACGVIKKNVFIYAPGIRIGTAGGARIVNNTIWGTPGDGIALAPNAQGARVSRNLIHVTRNGVYIAGDERFTSNGNRVVDNIITYVAEWALHGGNPSGKPVGRRNVLGKNCIWVPGRGVVGGFGFAAPGNRLVNPLFKDVLVNLQLQRTSPCWNQRPLR